MQALRTHPAGRQPAQVGVVAAQPGQPAVHRVGVPAQPVAELAMSKSSSPSRSTLQ